MISFPRTFSHLRIFYFIPVIVTLLWCQLAFAHEVRPAYLALKEVGNNQYDVMWKVPARGDMRLGVYIGFPEGVEQVTDPVGGIFEGAYIEHFRIEVLGGLAGKAIAINGLAATKIDVLARVEYENGATQTVRVFPDSPSFVVEKSPSLLGVAWTYLVIGVDHIWFGIDHLLFVLALVLLVKGWSKLLWTITAFTVAHSITLALATLGFVHVPGPPVEAIIALSIVFVASEILHAQQGKTGLTQKYPWVVAFVFGLLHGLGFAGALSEVGLPGHAIPLALLFFNVGVELGQVVFVGVLLTVFFLFRRVPLYAPSFAPRIIPYAIGSLAMFWVIERTLAFL